MICVQDAHRRYGTGQGGEGQDVLRGVSLDVPRGAFVALMGASGSGKTTLLNLIGGLDTPDSGTIRVGGRDLAPLDDDARSRFRLAHMGFVFQFFNLLPHLRVIENIELPLLLLGRTPAEANDTARAMASEVGLDDKLDRPVHKLSGGEMQRVALARALVHQPGLLLADEPTGNLDSENGRRIMALMRETTLNHGATVLMVTHDAEAAEGADAILHMVDGRITDTPYAAS